ncbi:CopG family transcriptional regulator [Sulfolobus sp. A20]|uniref:CopG family transcriptional regulator n=1 Tax=Saccharolobus sp. A20 TaxID=1891280 RepID=UPI000845C4D6|nr:CopG family transcriptional regulator [Sulfolobus sp. A20]TRM75553.1 CopG family transcriptional regulator [Sulfolobus sp. B5]TRM77800.1 CopG family transcriptional regulator [Sulfolobus sp. A20-N-F8]TRM81066.1 CopG family transcriptional regulator [Sulfolobus sp. D5]TRM81938.1 CopG family transcriptional regulator [Sulfolobus sp. A20-N-F6]TRM84682.1 CopG family transcriptional regulator [Sulfolobus sp. F3]TRM87533.1 CopG family transcriptional regulator [Sulfolobus sp. C3]TRM92144.1 CopG
MKIIMFKLTDEEYKELEERARREGYVLINDFIRSLIFSSPQNSQINQFDLSNQIVSRLEKKIQDMINPFTSQIEDIKGKIANLTERVETLEDKIGARESPKDSEPKKVKKDLGNISKSLTASNREGTKKTAMDVLREQGAIFESELKLNNPDAFFDKLEKHGAIIIATDSERIAVDQNFMEEFKKKISEIHTSDELEAQKYLTKQEYKLFQKLKQNSLMYFDATTKSWKLLVS